MLTYADVSIADQKSSVVVESFCDPYLQKKDTCGGYCATGNTYSGVKVLRLLLHMCLHYYHYICVRIQTYHMCARMLTYYVCVHMLTHLPYYACAQLAY